MQRLIRRKEPTATDELIKTLQEKMKTVDPTDEEYPKLMKSLKDLYEIKKIEDNDLISADTIAAVLGSLLGTAMVMIYERNRVITSVRAWGDRLRMKPPG